MNLCLSCGAEKEGALVVCAECSYLPKDELDRARHLVVADFDLKDALACKARLNAKEPIELDEAEVKEVLELLAAATPQRILFFALVVVTVPVMVLAVGLLGFAFVVGL